MLAELSDTLLAALIGLALSLQPVINGATAGALNSVFAAAGFSLVVSAVLVAVVFLASGAPTRLDQVFALPWWSPLGGVIGALYVVGGATRVPVTGAAVFFTRLTAGQLAGAVFADATGAFGIAVQSVSIPKMLGLALAFAGVLLVRLG